MIEYKTGDILTENVEALVNSVNCVGVMGRGIALQFKNAFPENFKAYAAACRRNDVQPGRMFVFETGRLANPRFIINFPTKRHWRGNSRIEDIDAGLAALVEEIRSRNIRSIAIPPLGSGLGGLNWSEVRPRIEATLRELDELKVVIFEPSDSEAIDRDSYRAEKQATMKIQLPDADAEIQPVPTSAGGGKPEPEMDRLSNILKAFNDQFGNVRWSDADRVHKLITEEIPNRVAADTAYQNAKKHSDKQNARIEHDKALARVMTAVLKDDTELFKLFSDNESFRRWLTDTIFGLTYEQTEAGGATK
jgi:O-acetyl-ADP-ribose deacetylase (regulator of RNase III)